MLPRITLPIQCVNSDWMFTQSPRSIASSVARTAELVDSAVPHTDSSRNKTSYKPLGTTRLLCSNAGEMRASVILGPGNVSKPLAAFQRAAHAQWTSLIEQADAVVVFGGDGTIHRNLPTLVDLGVPLMVVPCGSGNDFARSLGLVELHDSLSAWQKFASGGCNVRAIDLGVIHSSPRISEAPSESDAINMNDGPRYFCCSGSVGLDVEIVRRANKLPSWIRAHGGYGLSAPGEFFRFQPFQMKVCPNGNSGEQFRPTLLAAVANAPTYGGGVKIAPKAKLDDGKLDLCVVRAMDKFKLFCLFPTAYFGRHLMSKNVEYGQTDHVRIETEVPVDVYADGEYVCKTPVEFNVAREALQVIVPE
jgi:diacylglycerol kinase (ATP)